MFNIHTFQLQERVENKSSQANEWEKQTDILRRELSDKTHRLQQTEQTLAYTTEVFSTFTFIQLIQNHNLNTVNSRYY